MEDTKNNSSQKSFGSLFSNSKRVISLAWDSHKPYTLGLFFITIAAASLPYLQLGVFGLMVDEVINIINEGSLAFSDYLIKLLVIQAILLLLPMVIADSSRSIGARFRFVFLKDLNLFYVRKLADIDIATHERPSFNDKMNNARERGVGSIYGLWSHILGIVRNVVGVTVAGIILFYINPIFLLLAFVGALPAFFIETKHGKRVHWLWDSDAETRRLFFDRRFHFVDKNHLIELKLFQAVEFFHNQMASLIGTFTEKQVDIEKRRFHYELLGSLIFSATLIASVLLLLQLTIAGTILVGTMTFVFGSIRGFQSTLISFFKNLGSQEEDNRFVTDVFGVIDTEKEIPDAKNPIVVDNSVPPKIEFKDVWFKYPDTDTWVLENFNLTIEPGENLSIVGVNGAGKTTFVKLLNRFYDPTQGGIFINGINLKDLDLESWRSTTGVLFQEYSNYYFPIESAIAIGDTSVPVDHERVVDAANKSEAENFIQKFDKGYQQMLGKWYKDGVEISVGQQQRMAIARVFYRGAQVNILDEPTASIDADAEEKIFEQIHEEMREKTVITISHRFSTVKKSDNIAVIENGSISEYGNHTHLMLLGGTYARLYSKQAEAYQD